VSLPVQADTPPFFLGTRAIKLRVSPPFFGILRLVCGSLFSPQNCDLSLPLFSSNGLLLLVIKGSLSSGKRAP